MERGVNYNRLIPCSADSDSLCWREIGGSERNEDQLARKERVTGQGVPSRRIEDRGPS